MYLVTTLGIFSIVVDIYYCKVFEEMIKWNKQTKEVVSYIFAATSLIFGFGMCIASFAVPPLGIVHDSILWILGQCFVFAGGVTGIALSIDQTKKTIKNELLQELGK